MNTTQTATIENKVDPMTPVYFMIIYISIYLFFGLIVSFISEYTLRQKNNNNNNFCQSWFDNIGRWRSYYHSYILHVFDSATTISAIISLYCVCQDLYGTNISDWRIFTRQPKPGLILFLSIIIFILYRISSIIYLLIIDIFSLFQVILHLIDSNYLYEMYISHSSKNKNPIIQWMHKQYVYFSSLPQWFLYFVFLLRWNHLFSSYSSPLFLCILFHLLFSFLHIFYIILWCDINSFIDEGKNIFSRCFRLRFSFRFTQFTSRMIWLSYFWIFLGSPPFLILISLLLLNHVYLYIRGYLHNEYYHILTKLFIIPDVSIGMSDKYANQLITSCFSKILYIFTHCAGCMVGIWTIIDQDLLYIDMLFWLHWFEDLLLWAIITGIIDQKPLQSITTPYNYWNKMFSESLYIAFYSIGIITWLFQFAYFFVIRIDDFLNQQSQPLSITSGILGLAESSQWESLEKFLPRMKKTSINKKNPFDSNKTALHYAILASKWLIVEKLIDYGADINICDKNNLSSVHLICSNKNLSDFKLFQLFLNKFTGNPLINRDNNGKTLLHLICCNNTNSIELFDRIQYYFAVFPHKSDNKSVSDNNNICNIADNTGCTSLHYISSINNTSSESIELLINNGANINCCDNSKQIPLMYAIKKASNNIVIRYLLINGSNINHQNFAGWTALHFAANLNLRDNIDLLLEYFPDTTIKTNSGKTAYHLAKANNYQDIYETLAMNMPPDALIETTPVPKLPVISIKKSNSIPIANNGSNSFHLLSSRTNIEEEDDDNDDNDKLELIVTNRNNNDNNDNNKNTNDIRKPLINNDENDDDDDSSNVDEEMVRSISDHIHLQISDDNYLE